MERRWMGRILQFTRGLGAATLVGLMAACGGGDGGPTGPDPGPGLGRLEVRVTTQGSDPDPNGYTVTLDQNDGRALAPNGALTFQTVSAGVHSVGLGGVASNCAVATPNPRSVDVAGGAAVTVAFEVLCDPTGLLEVTTSTTGVDVDPDGYQLLVDGQVGNIGASARVTRADLRAGPHTVELRGVAENCALAGESVRSVDVPAGGVGRTTFEVACTGPTGNLRLTIQTTGDNPDFDGYTVTVDRAPGPAVAPNATIVLPDLPAGDHEVNLTGVADNCQTGMLGFGTVVTVQAGTTTAATLRVQCFGAPLGTLVVHTTTSNPPAGLVLIFIGIDGGEVGVTGPSGSATFQLSAGSHTVSASRPGPNCSPIGDARRTVQVPAGGIVQTTFQFSC